MTKETKNHLTKILARIEESTRRVLATRGYTRESANLKLLEELVKEQIKDENPDHTARPVR